MRNTLRKRTLDYIEFELGGRATWLELHKFMIHNKGLKYNREYRGYYSSYFSDCAIYSHNYFERKYKRGLLMRPSVNDSRHLVQINKIYELKLN